MTLLAPPPWWVGPAVAVVATLALVRECNGKSRAESALAQSLEREKVAGKALVAEQTSAAAVKARAADLEASNATLHQAVEDLQRLIPNTAVVAAGSMATGGSVAHGTPRPTPPAACQVVVQAQAPSCPAPPPQPACLLADGDTGEVRADFEVRRSPTGNLLVVGTGEAWRLLPAPATRLFRSKFDPKESSVTLEAPSANAVPGWGAGPWVGLGSGGIALGAALAPPPLRFWGLSVEVSGGAGVTPTGKVQGSAQALVRP